MPPGLNPRAPKFYYNVTGHTKEPSYPILILLVLYYGVVKTNSYEMKLLSSINIEKDLFETINVWLMREL